MDYHAVTHQIAILQRFTRLRKIRNPDVVAAPPEHRLSYWHRRTARHVMIAVTALAITALFWKLFAVRQDVISHLSIATAYPALLLTAAALLLGPWNVLHGHNNPVSFDLRRDLGIWAGIMALLHTGVGLNVHLRGRGSTSSINTTASDTICLGSETIRA